VKRRTSTFTAEGDDGRQYTVHVFTEFIPAGSHDDPGAVVEGLRELRTSAGQAVNYLGPGVY
jgi:hypothetical protein